MSTGRAGRVSPCHCDSSMAEVTPHLLVVPWVHPDIACAIRLNDKPRRLLRSIRKRHLQSKLGRLSQLPPRRVFHTQTQLHEVGSRARPTYLAEIERSAAFGNRLRRRRIRDGLPRERQTRIPAVIPHEPKHSCRGAAFGTIMTHQVEPYVRAAGETGNEVHPQAR